VGGSERDRAGVVKMLVLYVLARLNGMSSSERMQFAGV
jgi:glutathione-regulated potassium-efflux system protein KefB